MKKRRTLLFTLLALLLIIGIPVGLLVRQELLNDALIAAIKASNTEKAVALLNSGADANAVAFYFETAPLSERLLHKLQHWNEPFKSSVSQPAIFFLFYDTVNDLKPENLALMAALLDHGANPNAINSDGSTILMHTAFWGYNAQTRLLIQRGASVNARAADGSTALYCASGWDGNAETLHLLIAAGANVNAQADDGETAMIMAVRNCSPSRVQALIASHAELNLLDKNGKSALDYAIKMRKANLIQLLRKAGAKTSKELDTQDTSLPNANGDKSQQ
jgi:ankyrin repeat protein